MVGEASVPVQSGRAVPAHPPLEQAGPSTSLVSVAVRVYPFTAFVWTSTASPAVFDVSAVSTPRSATGGIETLTKSRSASSPQNVERSQTSSSAPEPWDNVPTVVNAPPAKRRL